MMMPYGKSRAIVIAIIMQWATSCSPSPQENGNSAASVLAVPNFRKLSKKEIAATLAGKFLDERPYACDDGPLMFKEDGTFVKADGWGGSTGRYVIRDGEVVLTGVPANRAPSVRWTKTIRLYRFGETIYFGGWKIDDILPLQLAPIDKHTIHLSCGGES